MIGLCVTNLLPAATASGGSWLAGAALTNLASRDIGETARSSDALAASTRFILDHGSAVSRRVLVLRAHNLSSAAQIRWSVGTSSGGNEVTTTGTIDAWRYTPRRYDGRDREVIVVLPTAATGRYDYVEIFDTTNASGYVDIGQAWLGPVDFTPTYNASYGLKNRLVDTGGKERSPEGGLWTAQQRVISGVSFVLDALSLDDGDALHELGRYIGTTEQMVYLQSLTDAAEMQRYGFIGTFDEMSDLDYPFYRGRSMALRGTQD